MIAFYQAIEILGEKNSKSLFAYLRKKLKKKISYKPNSFVQQIAFNLKDTIKLLKRDIKLEVPDSRFSSLWRENYVFIIRELEKEHSIRKQELNIDSWRKEVIKLTRKSNENYNSRKTTMAS